MKAYSFDRLLSSNSAELPSSKIISTLSSGKGYMDHFYMKGFEGLCLAMGHRALTEAVISSVVPMGGELLVIGDAESCSLWRKVCCDLSIKVSAIDMAKGDLCQAVETILSVNSRIGHVMCPASVGDERLVELGRLARRMRRSFVVDNAADELTMAVMEEAGVDFAISASSDADPVSVIVARRSRLVMAEGNARHADHDIYAAWQETLLSRNSTWTPMC